MTQYDDEWRGAERRPSYRRRPAPAYEAPRFDWTGVAALLILILFSAACFWYIMGAPVPAALPTPPAALPTAATYLQNVGAQAPHSPRSAPTAAPVDAQAQPQPTAGICAPPLCRDGDGGGGQAQGWAAQDAAPAVEAQPVALPTIEPAQAEVIGARQSNGCAAGQVFMPRSGCHTPGSGGAMPGPVGGAK